MLAVVRPADATRAAYAAYPAPAGYLPASADEVGFLVPEKDVEFAVPAAGVEPARDRALAAHATQVERLPGGFALSNRIAQPLPAVECFALLAGEPAPWRADGSPTDDIFAGLA